MTTEEVTVTFRELTEAERSLADEFDYYMGVDVGGSGTRKLSDEDDGLTDEERELGAQFDEYMKRPSREDADAAHKRRVANYTGLGRDLEQAAGDNISLALRLDSLTGLRR